MRLSDILKQIEESDKGKLTQEEIDRLQRIKTKIEEHQAIMGLIIFAGVLLFFGIGIIVRLSGHH